MDSPLKVEVKVGERAVERLIDAVVDAFSPATETLGFLGDAVRLARIEVAAAITRRAKAIADGQGLRLIAPPLKFLVPFYEKASTEDAEDETLVDMWARLLVAAGSDYDARHLRYTALLSEMSATQAKILQGMARNYDGVIGQDVDPDKLFYDFVDTRLTGTLKRIVTGETPDEMLSQITNEICLPGVSVELIQLVTKRDNIGYDWTKDGLYSDELSIDFEILRALGLIAKVTTDYIRAKRAHLSVILYHMTELGYDFWRTCCGTSVERPPGTPLRNWGRAALREIAKKASGTT